MKKIPFHLIFFMIIAIYTVMNLLKPYDAYSDRENRSLQSFPSLTNSSCKDGKFQTAFEKAANDQFYLRDGWIKLQRTILTQLGVKQIGEVLIGDDQLYQISKTFDETTKQSLISELHEFAKKQNKIQFEFLLIPTQAAILQEPVTHSIAQDQRMQINHFLSELSDTYHIMDTIAPLEQHKQEYIYYKGDHHWTTFGAYTVFDAWRSNHQLKRKETYEPKIINDAFYGTLSNQSGVELRDAVEIYVPQKNDIKTIVTYVEEQEKTATIYDLKKQYSANPYEIFFGGNHARIDIDTTTTENQRLLVIKDSYANCMMPFLLPYYHSITIVDPRYYYGSLSSIIKERHITNVMFLYNANTLFSDPSLLYLLQEEE